MATVTLPEKPEDTSDEKKSTFNKRELPHFGKENSVPGMLNRNQVQVKPEVIPDQNSQTVRIPSNGTEVQNEGIDSVAPSKTAIVIAVGLPPVAMLGGLILAIIYGGISAWFIPLILGGWVVTGLGITVGYHRLVAHRAFATHGWLRAFWLAVGAMALEGCPLQWSTVHRKHHKHSDENDDPHTPHKEHHGWFQGLFFSHLGWMFRQHTFIEDVKKFSPDLQNDPLVMFFHRTYRYWILLSVFIPVAIGYMIDPTVRGALLGLCLGAGARIFLTHHITWSINSVCHVFGAQPYKSKDHSRNNMLFGILAFGEGWHNNHHAFPNSARHGLKWWQFDLSWIIIRSMALCGLAWNVKTPTNREMELKSQN